MGFDVILTVGGLALIALVITAAAALKGWQAWLEVKKMELAHSGHVEPSAPLTGGRIEIADLRERVRKLEQIASGIDY